ncbi:glycosyltransferase [Microvirga sp. 2YAF29]|uniref:glycosyltransferase n=1 Tax=Microvirga sp. 2YAF29 TaxID=3233031 RepID=UPI003F987D5D
MSASISHSVSDLNQPEAFLLGRDVVLLVWDVPDAVEDARPSLSVSDLVMAPLASLRLARRDGGARLLWALRRTEINVDIALSGGPTGPAFNFRLQTDTVLSSPPVGFLLDGIDEAARLTLISALFNVWGPLFQLQRNITFVQTLRALIQALVPAPKPAALVAQAPDNILLVNTMVSAKLGKIDALYAIGPSGITRLIGQPHISKATESQSILHFLADGSLIARDVERLILVGTHGLSVRKIRHGGAALPSFERWLREHAKNAPGLRENLLVDLAERSPTGLAGAVEAQLRSPLKPRAIASSAATPSAEIVTALSTSAGTLVTGWYRDPLNLLASLEALGLQDARHDLTCDLYRFPVEVTGASKGARLPATGFVVLAPALSKAVAIAQPRFQISSKSGSTHSLVPKVQPVDPVAARAAALRSVPAHHVDERLLQNVLSPVIENLHLQARDMIGQPAVQRIGTPVGRPKVSVIVPLYRALDFLRFQIASFALDPWFRANAELIYVLDSPEQAAEVEHLLNGLYLVYALPMALAVMERNGGYARANNVGVSISRGDTLALVNSDIIPTRSGWLEPMIARLNGRQRIGAVGPKLLFEDGSIQHAGMYFGRDHRNRWLNQHFHKGMPRDYAPACGERIVPAVTGACLVTTRAIFQSVGGFTEDYVIGDYEDSDLCLKVTATGRKITYTPDVELYHLERKSMSLNAEYMRGIAWQYNCSLHSSRWNDLMTAIMQPSSRPRRARNVLA